MKKISAESSSDLLDSVRFILGNVIFFLLFSLKEIIFLKFFIGESNCINSALSLSNCQITLRFLISESISERDMSCSYMSGKTNIVLL